ncbi:MAG: tRNA (adenosine(37)-N6)-dimethylallyltransferase MiaA [Lachnospiraceae bacterium]|nr:tRNA (adenosine(37)-N6)-dimethylallyltransferase MiaA [Lachnospiraceae bacterium]
MNSKPPLIILSGPTATGKTDLSVLFALQHDLEIISADSAQVYRGMNIGSAKITEEEKKGIPHHLIDVCDIKEDYSAFRFKEMAEEAIADIYKRGKIPLVVGGTGFYIQALLKGVNFDDEGPDEKYRSMLQSLADEKGISYIHEMLKEIDPESAVKIPEGNVKRVIRALEYHHLTGKKISEHNEEESKRASKYNSAYFVLMDDRDLMYERIDKRVDKMMDAGLEREVRSLLENGADPSMVSMQAIGYKEMIPYIKGEYSLEEAVYQIKLRTRHFAKRQVTWYKREPDVIYINRGEFNNDNEKMSEFMYRECLKRGILNE